MAGIQEYLDLIKNAIYGKDVRQAIHDAIETCYEDGKAGAIDLVARQEIAELIALPDGSTTADAELTNIRVGSESYPKDYASAGLAVRSQINYLNSDLTTLGQSVFNNAALVNVPLSTQGTGYRLKSDGSCARNEAYYLDKYKVRAGDLLYLEIALDETETAETNTAAFQFQSAASVPTSNNPYLVGEVYARSFRGFTIVPNGATYLIVGRTNNTTNVVKSFLRQQEMLIVIGGSSGYISINGNKFESNASIYLYPYPYNGEYYNLNFANVDFSITCSGNKTLCLDLSKLGHNVLGDSSQAANAFVEVDYGSIPAGYMPILQYRSTNGKAFVFSAWHQFMNSGGGSDGYKFAPVSSEITKTNLVAHRGGNTKVENTLANFEDAIANGYTILECDVKFTSDEIPILSHDDTFNVGGVTYTISEMTWSEVHAVDSSKMLLSDFIKLCKRKNVVGELDCATFDNGNHLGIISDLITSLGMNGRCYFAVTAAGARNLLNVRSNHIISVAGMTSVNAVSGISDIVQKCNLCICSTRNDYVTAELVEAIHNAGCISKTYTVDTPSIIADMLTAGVDLIITNSYLPRDL